MTTRLPNPPHAPPFHLHELEAATQKVMAKLRRRLNIPPSRNKAVKGRSKKR